MGGGEYDQTLPAKIAIFDLERIFYVNASTDENWKLSVNQLFSQIIFDPLIRAQKLVFLQNFQNLNS